MKRIFLLINFALSTLIVATAQQTFSYRGLNYKTNTGENTCNVTGFSDGVSSNLEIPEIARNGDVEYKVIGIATRAFDECEGITSVTFPNSLTSIGRMAFSQCSGLTKINFPENLSTLGDGSFQNCENLESVIIPNSVKSIGSYCFAGCSSLSAITLPQSLTELQSLTFQGCSSLLSIEFPEDLTTLGEKSFMGCEKLTSVKFPNSLTSIGSQAFQNCTGLIMLDYPAANVRVGDGAFSNCSGLVKINFPNDLTQIGNSYDNIGIFSRCVNLKSIDFPASVTEIGKWTFAYCTGLTSLDLPNKLTKIGAAAFTRCTELQNVNFPNTLESIGNSSFSYCSGLTTLIFPESLTNIYTSAFSRCDGLTNIVFNSGPYLDINSFDLCPNINIIIYNTEVPFIYQVGMNIYDNDNIKTIFGNSNAYEEANVLVPPTILDKIKGITPWNYFEKIDQIPIATLNTDNLKIWAGDKDNINVSITPEDSPLGNPEIKWTSSNPDIITVTDSGDSASVTNLGKGNAEVYCNLNWKGLWDQTCKSKITIMEILTGIEIENTQSSLLKGESIALTTITNPIDAYEPNYTWSSSDETIANIIPSTNGNALLTGLKAGKVTITVEAVQEGSKGGHASKSMEFTILQPVESLSLNPTSSDAEEGDKFQITATILPEDASDKTLEWSSSDESIATVDNTGFVTVLKEGECIITAKTIDGSDLSANCYISATTGIHDISFDKNEVVDIYNLEGIKIKTNCKRSDIGNLPAGAYLLRKGDKVEKLIIR
ncbi:MAG: leucine-rich repeat protein [Muribaculaceae bacterium]|nr:leucine-rich repeat protein [Muribaculaceae bacterium]